MQQAALNIEIEALDLLLFLFLATAVSLLPLCGLASLMELSGYSFPFFFELPFDHHDPLGVFGVEVGFFALGDHLFDLLCGGLLLSEQGDGLVGFLFPDEGSDSIAVALELFDGREHFFDGKACQLNVHPLNRMHK